MSSSSASLMLLAASCPVAAMAFMPPSSLPLSSRKSTIQAAKICRPCITRAGSLSMMADDKQGGFFGNLINNALLKMVEVKEKDGTKKKLQKCVFCEGGKIKCEGCMGTGKDVALGVGDCFLCNGKGQRQCEICLGMGMVDRIRRGGTDTKGEWIGQDKEAMDPLSPQFEPYILTLDGAEKYTWCQCGVSIKQPFCDGQSHRAYGIKPVPFTSEGEKGTKVTAELCGCKYSNTKPYCDGSHVGQKAMDDANRAKK